MGIHCMLAWFLCHLGQLYETIHSPYQVDLHRENEVQAGISQDKIILTNIN